MRKLLIWLTPISLAGASAPLFRAAFAQYALWTAWRVPDPSGAELYLLNFQLGAGAAFVLFAAGAFLAGRWWFR